MGRDRRKQTTCIGTISRQHVVTRQTDCNLRANVATHTRALPAHREFAGRERRKMKEISRDNKAELGS